MSYLSQKVCSDFFMKKSEWSHNRAFHGASLRIIATACDPWHLLCQQILPSQVSAEYYPTILRSSLSQRHIYGYMPVVVSRGEIYACCGDARCVLPIRGSALTGKDECL